MSDIPPLPAAGDTYRCYYGKGNRSNKLIHVRAVVDEYFFVYRYWRGFRWHYCLDSLWFFDSEYITKVE